MGLLQEKLAKYDLPQKFMAQGVYPYFREIEGKQGTEVEMGGQHVLMFGSNAYTGLTGDERVIEAGIKAMHKYGSGCAGSRFLNGTLDLHVQLEKELAAFVGKDEALCFSTGFTVNSGVIPALTDRNDYIICDDRDHASIVDGRRLSFPFMQVILHIVRTTDQRYIITTLHHSREQFLTMRLHATHDIRDTTSTCYNYFHKN